MNKTQICIDNCSCLDEEIAKRLGVVEINLSCYVGQDENEESFLGSPLNTQGNRNIFLRKSKSKTHMKTCGLTSIDAFPIIKHHFPTKSILYLGISTALSGSTCNMNIDIEDTALKNQRKDYAMLDTTTVAGGQLILLENALALNQEGIGFEKLLESTKQLSSKIHDYFSVSDLTYLDMGGRMKIPEFSKSTKKICFYLGKLDKENGLILTKRALNLNIVFKNFIKKLEDELDTLQTRPILITFGDNLDNAIKLKQMIEQKFTNSIVKLVQASPPIISNTGDTILGISFVAK